MFWCELGKDFMLNWSKKKGVANGAPGVPVGALWAPLFGMAPIWCPYGAHMVPVGALWAPRCPNGAHGSQMGTDYSIFQKQKWWSSFSSILTISYSSSSSSCHIICINAWMIYPKTCILPPFWLYLSWWLVWFVCVSLLHLISWSTVRTLFVLSLGERCDDFETLEAFWHYE